MLTCFNLSFNSTQHDRLRTTRVANKNIESRHTVKRCARAPLTKTNLVIAVTKSPSLILYR